MRMRTRAFERLFGHDWARALLLGLPLESKYLCFGISPFFRTMEDSTSSQPSAASAVTDGKPTGGTDMAALIRQLMADLEQQGACPSQSAGESTCFILFRFVLYFFLSYPSTLHRV